MTQQSAADFRAGGVAVRMQDAIAAVRAFAGQHELPVFAVEVRTPAQQFLHALRAFLHQHARRFAIHQAIAGVDGVFQMQRDVFFAAHRDGDAALRVVGVRFAEGFLGHDQDAGSVRSQANRGAQAGDACADDDEVGLLFLNHEAEPSIFRL